MDPVTNEDWLTALAALRVWGRQDWAGAGALVAPGFSQGAMIALLSYAHTFAGMASPDGDANTLLDRMTRDLINKPE